MTKIESPKWTKLFEHIKGLGEMIASQKAGLEARPDANSNPQIKEQIHSSFIYLGALGDVTRGLPEHAQRGITNAIIDAYEKAKGPKRKSL